ncbi:MULTISPECIES: hypothetical protein [unclassified Paraburkholderia]|uniref:hypothetical protein n=1 Tax=unclassified Paraburkholderia TaxID=2615204 RepID=UPI0017E8B309|nr:MULTISPECIES: hypothetical protein [unclassified Paraburkholderia]MBB5444611.1 hypothetical protein [Paraburkholderia sp. WSM4177]MBB5485435.1 hypothetical protein [Paraburkholderia sp. WSM4180]
MRTQPALLAVSATATAACLSVMAGWQRGGLFAERVLWIAVGVVLVVAAHLLPALIRSHGWRIRIVGAVLWIGCMAATCYGHAVFFLMAQKHAGELRAAAVQAVVTAGRDLTAIAADRAGVVARLARVTEKRCSNQCAGIRIERTGLTARLDALDIEIAEAKRAEAARDRADAARDAALADPVTGALTAFGLSAPRADLIAGLAFAAVLEAVACFAWLLALVPAAVTEIAVTPVQQASNAEPVTVVTTVSNASAPLELVAGDPADDVTRVATAIAGGTLRATVAEIRKFLGCSQATAMTIRKRVMQADP